MKLPEFENGKIFTGVADKDGCKIYFGDKVRFADKWEWYRGEYGPKLWFGTKKQKAEIMKEFNAEPFEERIVESVEDYEWLLSDEIQSYWKVITRL